jgi:hypothetical protein
VWRTAGDAAVQRATRYKALHKRDKSGVSDFFDEVCARRPPAGLDKEMRDMEFGGEAAWVSCALSQHQAIMKRFDAVPDDVFCNVQGAGARGGVVALVSG